ncbi:Signal transduction regulator [Halanaeroarchaeum sp. HSR-CO]|uniref:bacterio-opsin activator domain-containing protein n=1 Tax=Halanaeroarchaeum sp. HSR-CO TaxID=2866382 RepID=UPI00217E9175|nr:bacterio-opsin activator domain-containing protein [Halanaeroarchaeum sp. HSR-CO]UWG47137.1 Signal transduction regulator [Halanaeroarchaeum sp. HSR-CO]
MDDLIIFASIALRIAGVGYSILLLYRVQDARFGFLTVMLTLMAARQIFTLRSGNPGIEELPGLVVSVFAVLTVVYLAKYVEQEANVTRTIRRKNERLRTFRKAIEHAGHAIFLTETDGTITYANQAVESVTGYSRGEVLGEDPSLWKSGEHDDSFYRDLWKTITSGEVWDGQIVNERKNGSLTWVDMTIAPIVDEEGNVEQFVAVDTDITERRKRKEKISEQKRQLEVLNHTNEVLRDVNQDLVQADTRSGIESAVTEEFAQATPYEFAWIATRNVTNESLRAREWSGIERDELTSLLTGFNADDTDPISDAIRSGTVRIDQCGPSDDTVSHDLDDERCRALAAIPLTYGETEYGALCIATENRSAFESIEEGVFAELGETIGYAINAIESKETLMTDSVTAVEFETRDADCFSIGMSAALGCSLDLKWLSPNNDDTLVEYFTTTGADPAEVVDYATDHEAVTAVQMIADSDEEALFRFEVDDSCVARTLGDFGADLSTIHVSNGRAVVTAHLSSGGDVRAMLEALQAEHGDVELLARREDERPKRTIQEIRATLDDELTDRQREALQTAFIGGFFEWPRDRSGEEIASVMGITQSTFLQHLRVAERKVLAATLQVDSATTSLTGPVGTEVR